MLLLNSTYAVGPPHGAPMLADEALIEYVMLLKMLGSHARDNSSIGSMAPNFRVHLVEAPGAPPPSS